MATDAIENPLDDLLAGDDTDFVLERGDRKRAAITGLLFRGESVVWAGRGIPRPLPRVPAFPAFFAAFLCAFSGFALIVMYGIQGMRDVGLGTRLFLLCLAPAVLGGVVAIGLAGAWARHRLWQVRVARSFYLVTDRRAIAGVVRRGTGDIAHFPWTADLFNGTRCIEHGDGTGAVYFTLYRAVIEPHWGFEGIREASRVEAMIHEIVLREKPAPGPDLREF